MKKLLLSAFFCLAAVVSVHAQTECTPNPAYSVPGIEPDSLPDACRNVMYDAVIDFVMPLDSTADLGVPFGTQQVYFCTFKLVGATNLPAGMEFYCSGNMDPNDATNRTWKVDHTPGVINRGCVRLMGIPGNNLSVDLDMLNIQILIGATFTNPATAGGVCTPLTAIPPTLTTQYFKVYWKINECGVWGVSVDDITAKSMDFSIAPNPTNTKATISMDMPVNDNLNVSICDMMGREVRSVFNGNTHTGKHTFDINTSDLAAGVYSVKVTVGNTKVITQKMVVNH